MIGVADTTPLLYLSRIGQLGLLHAVYRRVFIPTTVWREAVMARAGAPGVEQLRGATWIVVSEEAERIGLEHQLREALDAGEAAAIALAKPLRADLLLIDERKGRAIARERGLNVRGTHLTLP